MALIQRKPLPIHSAEIIRFDPVAWRDRFEERAGFLEFDCHETRRNAEYRAGIEAAAEWMRQNPPDAYSVSRCAHCDRALDHNRVPIRSTAGRAYVHDHCLVPFVSAWRGRAIEAMIASGMSVQLGSFPPPPVRVRNDPDKSLANE